jgi:serine protease Do
MGHAPDNGEDPNGHLSNQALPQHEPQAPRLHSSIQADSAALDDSSGPEQSESVEEEATDPVWDRSCHKSGHSTGTAPGLMQMAGSTAISLIMVLVLLVAAKWMVPSLVESLRYSWHSGQLRAEYDQSGQRLRTVSLDSLADVSQLVSQRLGASVVHVNLLRDQATVEQYEKFMGRNNPIARYEGQGSGFIVDPDGLILTNYHVISENGRIEVTLSDGRQVPGEIVGFDAKTDLAVLRVKANNLLPVEWGDSDTVSVGTPVWAVGSPYGLHQTVTFGIISGMHRLDLRGTRYSENVKGDAAYGDLMQSDVAVNPGNSGGPLVNSMGQVVGVNAAILGESYRGISFSIPSRVAKRVAESLIESGEVVRGWLGVRMEELSREERYSESGDVNPGIRIIEFPNADSPAKQAGLKVGDVIVEFRSKAVLSQMELMKMIGECDAGSTASVAVMRDDKRLEFSVTLGKRDVNLK